MLLLEAKFPSLHSNVDALHNAYNSLSNEARMLNQNVETCIKDIHSLDRDYSLLLDKVKGFEGANLELVSTNWKHSSYISTEYAVLLTKILVGTVIVITVSYIGYVGFSTISTLLKTSLVGQVFTNLTSFDYSKFNSYQFYQSWFFKPSSFTFDGKHGESYSVQLSGDNRITSLQICPSTSSRYVDCSDYISSIVQQNVKFAQNLHSDAINHSVGAGGGGALSNPKISDIVVESAGSLNIVASLETAAGVIAANPTTSAVAEFVSKIID